MLPCLKSRRLSELGPYYAVVAARKDPAASAIRAQMREAAGRLGLACAAAATAKAAPESAKGSGPSQHQEGPAGSRRFTPAQRAVAVALVEVMQSAMRDGKEAALAARLTLANNTPAARPFLATLPKNGQLLTVHQLEHRASDQLLENLTQLAQQCAAAHSQPLEVFTRSMQSSMRTAAADSIAIMRGLYERQHMFVARRWYQEVRRAFQQPGGPTAFALLFLACGIIVLHDLLKVAWDVAWEIEVEPRLLRFIIQQIEALPALPRLQPRQDRMRQVMEVLTLPMEEFVTREDLQRCTLHELTEKLLQRGISEEGLQRGGAVDRILATNAGNSTCSFCGICHQDYASGEVLRRLRCGHKFHLKCIDRWFLLCLEGSRPVACITCSAPLA